MENATAIQNIRFTGNIQNLNPCDHSLDPGTTFQNVKDKRCKMVNRMERKSLVLKFLGRRGCGAKSRKEIKYVGNDSGRKNS